jgi:hypothetical protein
LPTNNLAWYRGNITSQNGEDGVIEEIFYRIGAKNRWCVDVGASDGKFESNTWNLIANEGWSGLLIEPAWERFEQLKVRHRKAICLRVKVEQQLDKLIAQTPAPHDFDLLSIDVDGEDQTIWASLKNYEPRVVIIEVDSRVPTHLVTKSSLASAVLLGKEKGYELALHTGNAIFVRRDYADMLGIDRENWEELFDRSWLEDGTLFAG